MQLSIGFVLALFVAIVQLGSAALFNQHFCAEHSGNCQSGCGSTSKEIGDCTDGRKCCVMNDLACVHFHDGVCLEPGECDQKEDYIRCSHVLGECGSSGKICCTPATSSFNIHAMHDDAHERIFHNDDEGSDRLFDQQFCAEHAGSCQTSGCGSTSTEIGDCTDGGKCCVASDYACVNFHQGACLEPSECSQRAGYIPCSHVPGDCGSSGKICCTPATSSFNIHAMHDANHDLIYHSGGHGRQHV